MTGDQVKNAGDVMLAGTLTSSPVWVPVLNNINIVLTTLSLLIGVGLALGRLWFWARKHWPKVRHNQDHESPPPGGPYF